MSAPADPVATLREFVLARQGGGPRLPGDVDQVRVADAVLDVVERMGADREAFAVALLAALIARDLSAPRTS